MQRGYTGRTVFTKGRAVLAIVVASTAVFVAAAVTLYFTRGLGWMTVTMGAIAIVFGIGGILETLVERIELTPDAMVVRRLWGTQRYAITDIERVEEGKGVPPALLLKSGVWVKLPGVGGHLGNSVRAWRRAHVADSPSAASR